MKLPSQSRAVRARPRLLSASLLLALLATGCGSRSANSPNAPPASQAAKTGSAARPSIDQLENGTYRGIYENPVRLAAGRFEGEPFLPGASSRPTLTLVPDRLAFGDLDRDGTEEGVVLLVESSGGSGSFVYLAVMSPQNGDAENVATTLIGDCVQVAALEIDGNRVLVRSSAAAPPGSPAREVVREWTLQDGALVERKIRFDLDSIDDQGLLGPADGKRALSYEFCVPRVEEYLEEVGHLDRSARMQPGASGRVGCTADQVLFIGSTHQPRFREVLEALSARPYVERIERTVFE